MNISENHIVKINHLGCSFMTPYLLVWGTLRKGGGNYNRLLNNENVEHVGSFIFPGFIANGITGCYTGDSNYGTVVDLFKITNNYLEINESVDALEGIRLSVKNMVNNPDGGYRQMIVNMIDPESNNAILAKMYYVGESHLDYILEQLNGKFICDYFSKVKNFDELPLIQFAI